MAHQNDNDASLVVQMPRPRCCTTYGSMGVAWEYDFYYTPIRKAI